MSSPQKPLLPDDTTRRYSLLAEHHQLCEEARDWYSQAIKDDQPAFIAWVRQFVPQPLHAAVLGIHHGISPETTIQPSAI